MILGRNTVIIMATISAILGFIQVVLPVWRPEIDREALAITLAATGTLISAVIALIANTSTTPVGDPRLPVGTTVNAGLPDEAVVVQKGN